MSEPLHPIRTVALRTGLSTHVLRAWERRYGAVEPKRAAGGGRLYSNGDIERFRLLRRLTEEGHAIGRIAALPAAELEKLLLSAGEGAAPASPPSGGLSDRFVSSALEAIQTMDAASLYTTLMSAVLALTSTDFTEGVLTPLLQRTGKLWEEGKVTTAHEHLLTVQASRVLGWLATSVPAPRNAPNAIAVTPSGERHEFGALLAAVTAAEEGWRVTYLGADLPADDVVRAVELRNAKVVLLSSVAPAHAAAEAGASGGLAGELEKLGRALHGRARVFVGGAGARGEQAAIAAAGAVWIDSLQELRLALRELEVRGLNG